MGLNSHLRLPTFYPINISKTLPYDFRSDLGNNAVGHGEKYKGRGFVQLTGHSNYKEIGKAIGLGDRLVDEPELANEPDIAAQILARFLKNKEKDIKQDLLISDLKKARWRVNGGDHGFEQFKAAFNTGAGLTTAIA